MYFFDFLYNILKLFNVLFQTSIILTKKHRHTKFTPMRLVISISAILFFSQVLNITAEPENFEFRHLTTKDGLSRSSVICILQDSKGFMWFGTEDGLNRYDGYEFKVFRMSDTTNNTISHNWIWDIFEDNNNNLWIATWQGLTKYDMKRDRFKVFLPDSANSSSISGMRPSSICSDKNNFIWIATWGGGLNRYDPGTKKFKAFHHDSTRINSLPGDKVRYVLCDHKNRLWAGTWSGLALANISGNDSLSFYRFTHEPHNPGSIGSNKIKTIYEDREGRIWIGTIGGGLNMFNEKDSSFVKFTHNKNDPRSISSNDISEIFEDSRHRLWIGTPEDGLNLFDRTNNTFKRVYSSADNPNSLLSNNVYSIYEDRSGLLWVGAGGINILKDKNCAFRNFQHSKRTGNSIASNNVTSFYEDENGIVWIGTKGGGLNCYNIKTETFRSGYNRQDQSLKNINAVTGIPAGRIYFATVGKGLFYMSCKNRLPKHIKNIAGITKPDALLFINAMCFTENRFLWMATYDSGLIKYDTESGNAETLNISTGKELIANYLLCITPGSKGDMWIGSWGAGLYRVVQSSGTVTSYRNAANDPWSISGNMVYSVLETVTDNKRTLWAGTENGLSFMHPDDSSDKFRHIKTPGNYVMGLTNDNSGNIWLSTNNGLARLNVSNMKLRRFDETDNINIREFNPGACLKLKNGKLLFGGTGGFVMVDPQKISTDTYRPPIVLTHFKLFNKEYHFGTSIRYIKKINLSHNQSFFSFEFAALDFSSPSKVNYYYKLKGLDEDWVNAGTRRYAIYTNIPPGAYTFKAKAVTGSEVESRNTISVDIRIKPPFWRTWWFITSMTLLVLLILYGLYRLRIQKFLAIEKLRVRIASDLHDDIGTSLTRISITSEQIQNSNDRHRIQSLSDNIGVTSREIVSTMSDIVWSIDSRNDNLYDLTDRMQDLAYKQLVSKDIKVNFKKSGFEKNKKITVDKRQNIFYIFKEAVNNIVKHSHATEIDITLKNDADGFFMEISDNGTGFDAEKIKHGNGIRNMHMRAKRLNANFEIKTVEGTKIILAMRKL